VKNTANSLKWKLREIIAQFRDLRDSQLQIEKLQRETEQQSAKDMLSDTGLDQGRGFESADEFNQRLNEAAGQTTDEPDATVVLPERIQRRDCRVHFDDE
jgi:hypothetical protein